MKFPRFVFQNNGPYDREGGTYDQTLVYNEAEYEVMIKSGWSYSIPEAVAYKAPVYIDPVETTPEVTPEDAPPTRAELEAKLTELGIKFDKRLGDKKLESMINKALEG